MKKPLAGFRFNTVPAPTAPPLATNEDTPGTSQVTHNDPDAGDTHTYAITTAPANGIATVNATGLVSYTPNANYNGADTLTVTVTDAATATGTVAIPITVAAVNDVPAPTAPVITTSNNTKGKSQVTHNDPDAGDTHTYAVTTAPANGTAVVSAAGLVTYTPGAGYVGADGLTVTVTDASVIGNATGLVSYTPNANYNGADTLTVTVTDAATATGTVAIPITVAAVNDVPAPTAPVITTSNNTKGKSQVTHNDPDAGDTHTYAVTTAPANGTAVVSAAGLVTYTPGAGYVGADGLTVTVTDASATTGTVVIAITVIAPIAPKVRSSGGCVINDSASFDPLMPLLVLLAMLYLGMQRTRRDKD